MKLGILAAGLYVSVQALHSDIVSPSSAERLLEKKLFTRGNALKRPNSPSDPSQGRERNVAPRLSPAPSLSGRQAPSASRSGKSRPPESQSPSSSKTTSSSSSQNPPSNSKSRSQSSQGPSNNSHSRSQSPQQQRRPDRSQSLPRTTSYRGESPEREVSSGHGRSLGRVSSPDRDRSISRESSPSPSQERERQRVSPGPRTSGSPNPAPSQSYKPPVKIQTAVSGPARIKSFLGRNYDNKKRIELAQGESINELFQDEHKAHVYVETLPGHTGLTQASAVGNKRASMRVDGPQSGINLIRDFRAGQHLTDLKVDSRDSVDLNPVKYLKINTKYGPDPVGVQGVSQGPAQYVLRASNSGHSDESNVSSSDSEGAHSKEGTDRG